MVVKGKKEISIIKTNTWKMFQWISLQKKVHKLCFHILSFQNIKLFFNIIFLRIADTSANYASCCAIWVISTDYRYYVDTP